MIKNISNFSSVIDGFLIDHILKSVHYQIQLNNKNIGYFSIYDNSLLTQFYNEQMNAGFYDLKFSTAGLLTGLCV